MIMVFSEFIIDIYVMMAFHAALNKESNA